MLRWAVGRLAAAAVETPFGTCLYPSPTSLRVPTGILNFIFPGMEKVN